MAANSPTVLVIGNGLATALSSKQPHLPLCYHYVSWVLNRVEFNDAHIVLLSSYVPDLKIPSSLSGSHRLTLLFGSGFNEHLITSAINEHRVKGGESIIDSARLHLASLTHTLEAVRKAERIPNFVHVSVAPSRDDGAELGSLYVARFTSALSLLHAFAASYRVPIKVAKAGDLLGPKAFESIAGLFPIGNGIAEATKKSRLFEIGLDEAASGVGCVSDTAVELEPAARILIYGMGNRFGSSFAEACRSRGVPAVGARRRPGIDADAVVAAEIDSITPSHVAYLINGATDEPDEASGLGAEDRIGTWLDGEGPTNLLHNMQRHFYAVWTLANACVKRGVHFTYVGTSSIGMQRQAINVPVVDESNASAIAEGLNRYEVVEKWASRSVALFKPIQGGVLRVRLQGTAGLEASPRLLDLVLRAERGCFSMDAMNGLINADKC